MGRLFVISDTHFFHNKLIKIGYRKFYDLDEMINLIVTNWKETVTNDDIVLHLGDVTIGRGSLARFLVAALPGYKILLMGNHDRDRTVTYWKRFGAFQEVYKYRTVLRYDDYVFSHRPIYNSGCLRPTHNFHGHWHDLANPSSAHTNVSVERTGYAPVKILDNIHIETFELFSERINGEDEIGDDIRFGERHGEIMAKKKYKEIKTTEKIY